ncbi:MAG: NAD(P)/FAD-dependent oxidoreductase [Pseudomonadota bacterium]|nr:NAD(P)/FAD-dependent oxidoreductase [Pseudomonadota bacterium]
MSKASRGLHSVDVVIVGAGFSGLYLLHKLRKQGFSTRVFERGSDVGGTWYWNRYPGARCDVESMQYSYSFDQTLQQDWSWAEKYAAQPEILAYLNHVADRFNLRKDIDFDTEVTSAHFDEELSCWNIKTNVSGHVWTQFFIMATGCISTPQTPKIKGLSVYQGKTYHTGAWPHEKVDFTGQRIAVIGTGSSGIQSIPVLAKEADHVIVFQRTPHWSVPARNVPMTDEYEKEWKADYAVRRQEMRYTVSGSLKKLKSLDVSALSVTEKEREEIFRERWEAGGMTYLRSFNDLLTEQEANDTAAEYVRERIRSVVKDPAIAELLAPKTYPIGTKRLCLDTNYYETFNRDNVELVDISSQPIELMTPTGLQANGRNFEFDSVIFAIGFDAMTGTLFNVDIRGRKGRVLKDKWCAGPRTYLGLMSADFPNMFMITGPGSPSVKSNMLTSIEQHVEFVVDGLTFLRDNDLEVIEPELKAEDRWVDHVQEAANATLFPHANSWYMGANIPGKPRLFMPYIGGVGKYRKICEEIVDEGYRGFRFQAKNSGVAAAE